MSGRPPVVLTIAGSDPSGGAGIQADLRVFATLGVVGVSAITALTVQNSRGVFDVRPVPGELLFQQIETLLEDDQVDAVKIGMLAGEEQVTAVADALRQFRPPNVVLDPVLASTGGYPLLDIPGREALLSRLLPLCCLSTPNLPELQMLTGITAESGFGAVDAARALVERGAGAVLVKGGHRSGSPVDTLVGRGAATQAMEFSGERVDTPHTHGTGCFLSAAIAATLALGADLPSSVRHAKALLTQGLRRPIVIGAGRGYPAINRMDGSARDVPGPETAEPAADQRDPRSAPAFAMAGSRASSDRLWTAASSGSPGGSATKGAGSPAGLPSAAHAQRIEALRRGLYVITDTDLRPDRSTEQIARQALAGGATVIQLRDKRRSTAGLVEEARQLAAIAHDAGALLIVNDRVDVALAADADGVHLGPDDMHPSDARRILGPDRMIGVSAGTVEEAVALAPVASYIGVGAIFGSSTKQDAGDAIGPERLREIRSALGERCPPLVAIGGITAENIAEVARAGADAAAVVSAVICAPDMAAAAARLLTAFRAGRQN